ncbi:MAG: hypothetical protein INR73_08725 [Williamsia sp.]|nr:hypothetical protein [Williamsia sp.]
MKKKLITTVIGSLLLLHARSYAQAQAGAISPVQAQAATAAEKLLHEKVFLHTDKTFYVAGDVLWFKLYCMEEASHRLLDVSKVAYIEVLDKASKPQLQAKIALDGGEGNGSFMLPVSIPSGSYTIRAYTNWMKNFGAASFFEKSIAIVNTFKRLEPVAATTPLYQIDFFPEGGQLVTGLQSKVAFKLVDRSLHGVEGKGAVVDDRGDTVCRFQPYKFGMGSFVYVPQAGRTYKALVSVGGNPSLIKNLPAALEGGWVLNLQAAGEQLRITVKGRGTHRPGENLYLTASNRQKLRLAQKATLEGDSAVFRFTEAELGEGISLLTVFNEAQQPVCERPYFKQPASGMTISTRSDAAAYGTRKKVSLSLLTTDSAARPLPANLSLSVYLLDSLQATEDTDLVDWVWLRSELRGFVESPRYYFTQKDPQAAENLVLTHGWRKFRDPGSSAAGRLFQYTPEFYGHLITGKVTHALTGKPQPGIQTFLSVPGIQTKFNVQKSGDSGEVKFDVKDYYGAGELVVQTHEQDTGNYRVDIASPFFEEYTGAESPLLQLDEKGLGRLTRRSIGMQVQHAYTEDSISKFGLPQIDTLPFFGHPDHQYLLDNYTRFVTMEEVLREYVREINVRNHNGELEMIMLNEPRREFFNGNLLVLVDGVPVFDQTKIFSYDPMRVKKLDVVSNQYFMGYYAFNGIASFTTYKGGLDGFQLDPKAVVIDYEGLQLEREFYAPQYSGEEQRTSRTPDFRSVLQWSPTIKTDGTGKKEISFYTSDIKGRYLGVVEGISADGKLASSYFTIQVD